MHICIFRGALMAICLNTCGIHIGNIKLGPINQFHRRADVSLFMR